MKSTLEKAGYEVLEMTPNSDKSTFKSSDKMKPIEVTSIDELKTMCDQLKAPTNIQVSVPTVTPKTLNASLSSLASQTIYAGNGTASQWGTFTNVSPLLAGTWGYKNISFAFQYQYYPLAGYYIFVPGTFPTLITSSLSGLNVLLYWTQTSASGNQTSDGQRMNMRADAQYGIGVKILGLDATIKVNSTWNIQSNTCSSYR